ncbi:MAG: MlaC/ttg2D family ABC transporter substrate-binding protein [Candidatus Rokuibacteriota bacterium]
MPHRAFLAIACLAWLLATVGFAEAGSPTDALRATFTQANTIISDPATEDRPRERLTAVRALFGKVFDFRGAAERVLGSQWQARTTVEQREFTSIFTGFVQHGFVYWLASVAAIDASRGGITVYYLGESVHRDRAAVRTAILGRGGRQIRLDHEMIYKGSRWMVRDVTIDGISLLTNYRAQFDRVIRASSYRELLTRMKERVAGERARPAAVRPEPLGLEIKPLHIEAR